MSLAPRTTLKDAPKPRRRSLELGLEGTGRKLVVDERGQSTVIDRPLVTSRAQNDLPALNEDEEQNAEDNQRAGSIHHKVLKNVEEISSSQIADIVVTSLDSRFDPFPSLSSPWVSTGLYPQQLQVVFKSSMRLSVLQFSVGMAEQLVVRFQHPKYTGLPSDPQPLELTFPPPSTLADGEPALELHKHVEKLSGIPVERLLFEVKSGFSPFCVISSLRILGEVDMR